MFIISKCVLTSKVITVLQLCFDLFLDDIDGQKRALFEYIAINYEKHEITWTKIADALELIARDLAVDIRQKYCGEFGD